MQYSYRNNSLNLSGMGDVTDLMSITDYASDPNATALPNDSATGAFSITSPLEADPTVSNSGALYSDTSVSSSGTSTSPLNSFNNLLQTVGQAVGAAGSYRRVTLADGTTVYQRINPLTGLPITTVGTVTATLPNGVTGTMSDFVKNNALLLAAVGIAAALMLSEKRG